MKIINKQYKKGGQTYLLVIYNNREIASSWVECMCWFRIKR